MRALGTAGVIYLALAFKKRGVMIRDKNGKFKRRGQIFCVFFVSVVRNGCLVCVLIFLRPTEVFQAVK